MFFSFRSIATWVTRGSKDDAAMDGDRRAGARSGKRGSAACLGAEGASSPIPTRAVDHRRNRGGAAGADLDRRSQPPCRPTVDRRDRTRRHTGLQRTGDHPPGSLLRPCRAVAGRRRAFRRFDAGIARAPRKGAARCRPWRSPAVFHVAPVLPSARGTYVGEPVRAAHDGDHGRRRAAT